MKIALVRLTAMGDVIHTAASIQFIKAALPDSEITWFVEEKFAPILEHNPQIDRIVTDTMPPRHITDAAAQAGTRIVVA